jgi:membrane associated rhomboid family serine protease
MFLPLYDHNPLRAIRRPYVTHGLIAANVLVFVIFQSGLVLAADRTVALAFGFIPAVFYREALLPPDLALIPQPLTLITYMFLHGGWMHLGANMLFLWVFGDNVEDDMGHLRYLVFYVLVGMASGMSYAVVAPISQMPVIGASGAISGVVVAYAMLHPRVKLWILVLMRIPLRITALWAISAWIVVQIVNFLTAAADDNTAWSVHVGGIVAGAALVIVLRRPGVPLFGRGAAA